MKNYENTFIRDPSPTYSDEADSENVITATLPLGPPPFSASQPTAMDETSHMQPSASTHNFLDDKFNCVFNNHINYDAKPLKQESHTFAFWTIVVILLVLCVGNLILTITIMGVLHLGRGIHGMELIPEEDAIKFWGISDLDRIYSKGSGHIEGFLDVPVNIMSESASKADEGGVYIRLHRNGAWTNRLSMDKNGIHFRAVNTFEIKDPISGASVFTTHRPHYNMPKGAEALLAKTISASRIVSPIGKPLTMESDSKIAIKGSEGINIDAFSALLQAEHNININSTQGATILEAGSGIYLDMDKIPIVSSEFGLRTGSVQYKLCVCMPQGTIFQIAIPRTNIHNGPKISCAHFSSKHDPCTVN